MSKVDIFDNGDPILQKSLTYLEFLDLMTDAWLLAEDEEKPPPPEFRKAMARHLDNLMNAKFEGSNK